MKVQFFTGTIWGETEILQGERGSAGKTALPSPRYISITVSRNVTSDS